MQSDGYSLRTARIPLPLALNKNGLEWKTDARLDLSSPLPPDSCLLDIFIHQEETSVLKKTKLKKLLGKNTVPMTAAAQMNRWGSFTIRHLRDRYAEW